jgi:hypothetical protein
MHLHKGNQSIGADQTNEDMQIVIESHENHVNRRYLNKEQTPSAENKGLAWEFIVSMYLQNWTRARYTVLGFLKYIYIAKIVNLKKN